jgi:hypothetical protein
MNESSVIIKRNDTKILFSDIPKIDGVPMTPDDVAGCTVSFILKGKAEDGTDVAIKTAATITSTTDPDTGETVAEFQYEPSAGDVAKTGVFRQEWELVFPSAKILTFPNTGSNTVRIIPDLG